MTNKTINVALWALNLSRPVSGFDDWAALVSEQAGKAKSDGAEFLVMPEYMSEQWLHFQPRPLQATEQIAWMADQVDTALVHLTCISKEEDIVIVAGTVPVHASEQDPPFLNRSHVMFPDGKVIKQDKLCLTPKEKNLEGWNLSPGHRFTVFEWKGYRCAVVICLDIELPALSARIASENIDMVFVPSMTKNLAGFHRVFDCAKARAVELQAAICAVGCIGHAPGRLNNTAGAAVYVPCEEEFGHTGLFDAIAPVDEVQGPGPVLLARDIPLSAIKSMRSGRAEVWPGAWSGEHIQIS